MTFAVWMLVVRAIVASSYMTLALANPSVAKALALPYGALVAVVAFHDLHHKRY